MKEISGGRKFKENKFNNLPSVISVTRSSHVNSVVPASVWRQGSFRWNPLPFGVESEKLNDKIIEVSTQNRSLSEFIESPNRPVIYGIGGSPDDSKAKLFAAYLVQLHIDNNPNARVSWETMYGGYDNPLLKEYSYGGSPTMLVLSNLTSTSTAMKLEKSRDLLERFSNIPRIVINAGEDPMSFLFTRLNVPINAIAYFSESIVKKRIEII